MMNFHESDPEFMERMEYFTFEEVVKESGQELPEDVRYMAILATLLGCQGLDVYKEMLPKALDGGANTNNGKGNCLSGSGLSGHGKSDAIFVRYQ